MRRIAPFVAALLFSAPAIGADDTPSAAPAFTYDLFDGKTLHGWTAENGCSVKVEDGAIKLEAGDGWLRSDYTYADFELHIEWQALQAEKYDAGIYIRSSGTGTPFPKPAYQINLLQGKEGFIGNLRGAEHKIQINPPGQWNTFDIKAVGGRVSLAVNGKPAYKVDGLEQRSGYIGLQVEVPKGGQFLFRNLRVTELGSRSLFDGANLSEWEAVGGAAEPTWQIADGVLAVTNRDKVWLRSKQQYDDFNLRFDYRVEPGANSGIYVRVPADGNHHRDNDTEPPAGFEVQLLDDSARKYADLKPYQYSGSVYDIAGAKAHVCKLPGEWNTLEINCRGQHVTTVHNGVVIVDARVEEFPLLALRQTAGYLGLQNHGEGVSFRNIRIGPALEQ